MYVLTVNVNNNNDNNNNNNRVLFKRGKLTGTTSVELDRNAVTKDLEQGEVYKYFGVDESDGIQQAAMKKNNKKKRVLPESISNPEERTR